jgi:mRNA interferase MazF
MPSFLRNDVILVRYPFSDLSDSKVRPAIIVSGPYPLDDLIIVPVTSRVVNLQAGEFVLAGWRAAGLHVPSAVKRGIYTTHISLVLKQVGHPAPKDRAELNRSLRQWLAF